jgi:hypothetical protein
MSKFKGTKGKWELIEGDKDKFSKVKIGKRLLDLRTLDIPSTKYKEEIANAKLISCAPEMLELLKNFTNSTPEDGTWNYQACMEKAKQLIKKATEL